MDAWRQLNEASAEDARALLTRCCGSPRWVDRMLARRPFESQTELLAEASDSWHALNPDDWREAFSYHPKIGDRDALRTRFPATHDLSEQEQGRVRDAPDTVLDALADGNRLYEQRFGYIFIVCATGKTADEMLEVLQSRLENDPETEIHIAAKEQAKITALRLLSW